LHPQATHLVLLTALLMLGLTLALSTAALGFLADPIWFWLTLGGVLGVLVVLGQLSRHANPKYLAAMVAIRLLSLALTVLRLILAFASLGLTLGWFEAALYAAAPTLGAAVGIVPAGIGVNEAIAAALAMLIAASPATAFLAVTLNRMLDLVVGAALMLGLTSRRWRS